MDKAGNGIFAKEDIKPFKWIGFYPGKIIDTEPKGGGGRRYLTKGKYE